MSDMITINTDNSNMTIGSIDPYKVYDDSILIKNRMCLDVKDFDSSLSTVAKRLRMTLKLYGALGLAAPQCNILLRLFVMSVGDQFITCINPRIVDKSEEKVREKEMCLSFVGMSLTIDRSEWIDVEYYDETGKKYEVRLTGLTGRIFQHELDHLNGIRMIDHVGPAALLMAKKKQSKLMKQYDRRK